MFNTVFDQKINKDLIEKEHFFLYMNEMLRNYIGSIFIGLPLFYLIFQSQSSLNAVNIWFTLDVILLITVLITYYFFYQYYDTFPCNIWKKISDIPLIIFSLHIASAPWLFLQMEADIYLYTLFIMTISLSGTVTHAIAYYFDRLVIFATLPLLSLAFKYYTMEDDNLVAVYIVLISVWAGLITFAHRLNKSLISSIVLKFEHIQARENAERLNSEKSQFIAAASHDIRQPLQAINLLVSTLKSRNTKPNDTLLFDRLEDSVESMSELLNSMLDVSKLDAHVIVPQLQHLCLTSLLDKLQGQFKPLAKAKYIDVVIEEDNNVVLVDSILLEQVLSNLLSNAIRYTDSGTIILSVQSESGRIQISVKDTGVGIANSDQEAIFLEFHQLGNPERNQKKGLGLGLSIVKRLCALQNWPLSLKSELGIGSCFSFSVPKGDSKLIQVSETVDMKKNLTAIDIIVIDDHESIRFSLSNILSNWGCKVRSFESADNACEAIKRLPNWKPNLIISDYRLHNNLTGIEAINNIKKLLSYPIEAIVISGDTAPEEIIKIEKSGFIVLHKPVKPAKLRVIVSRMMKPIIESSI